jgi:hypothetical protein
MKTTVRALCVAFMMGTQTGAQKPAEPVQPALSSAALAALDELSPRFAGDVELHQGWFRDRAILYYDFGPVPDAVGRALWPIHGFDARGNPVAIRGQRPIFSTVPGLDGYSGIWRLAYVVVADKFQANQIRDIASAEALVNAKRAVLQEVPGTLNLPLVARGSRLARDSAPATMGWYEGREVQFFDFGASGTTSVPLIAFVKGIDSSGTPEFIREQLNIVDTLPVTPPYADLWHVRFAHPDSTYVANTLKSAAAVAASTIIVDQPGVIRNCPVAIVDGARVTRAPSPLTTFADMRSPFPPKPTRPLVMPAQDSSAAKPPQTQ